MSLTFRTTREQGKTYRHLRQTISKAIPLTFKQLARRLHTAETALSASSSLAARGIIRLGLAPSCGLTHHSVRCQKQNLNFRIPGELS
ncbi:hypothetical protein [Bradyrhizobium sp. ORS 285]|uniref:hypothetical protein n=1 Tax=Bradyrhizobium sp. ORS 285 TaxID=115808 RepID=UPI0011118FA4|nr:hypothetical protein [Bradyrhizobium sp. ORS 285]